MRNYIKQDEMKWKIIILLTSTFLGVLLARNVEYLQWRESFQHYYLPSKESRFQFSIHTHQFCNRYCIIYF